jgi:hypothetical protein
LKITNSTLLGTPAGGAVEYDGSVAYFTPSASAVGGHGLLPTEFFYVNASQRSLTTGAGAVGSANAQPIYGGSGTGVGLSLAGSTTYEYELEGWLAYWDSSTATNNLTLQLTCSNTPNALFGWFEYANDGFSAVVQQVATTSATNISQQIGSLSLSGAGNTLKINYRVKGIIRTNAACTFTPQAYLSANNSSLFAVSANAWAKVKPIGSSSVTSIGAWA